MQELRRNLKVYHVDLQKSTRLQSPSKNLQMKVQPTIVQVYIVERTLRRALENVDEAEDKSNHCLSEASLIRPVASHTFS